MARQPVENSGALHCAPPVVADYNAYKRAELIALAAEQTQALADMRCVLYRETDALREELSILQAENRALKETLRSLQEKLAEEPLPVAPTLEEAVLKEKLRPIVAKLLLRHQQETQALQRELMALRQKLAQEQEAHQEALLALARVEERCQDLDSAGESDDEGALLKVQEYQRALKEAMEQAARQEETVHSLTRQLEASTAQARMQRTQAMEYLCTMRESFEQISHCLVPEESPRNAAPPRVAVYREKLMPFTRDHARQ